MLLNKLDRTFNASSYIKERNIVLHNPKVKSNIKITFISDIHISRMVKDKDIYVLNRYVEKEHPDYLCVLGDIVDLPSDTILYQKRLETFFKESGNVCPTIYIKACHDLVNNFSKFKYIKEYEEIWKEIENYQNVFYLDNIIYEDNQIFIAGHTERINKDNYNKNNKLISDLNNNGIYNDLIENPVLYRNIPTDKLSIAEIHSPYFRKSSEIVDMLSGYDFIASGHFHQGCLPAFIDDIFPNGKYGIISPKRRLFPSTARGIEKISDNTYHLINGGIATLSNSAPNFLKPLNHLCYQYIDNVLFTNQQVDKEIEIEHNHVKTLTLIR